MSEYRKNYQKPWIKKESWLMKQKRAIRILARLEKAYPQAGIALNYGNRMQLLVAVILSAQCTDKKVNEVTATLFHKYRSADDFARTNPKTFEKEIYQTGFYRAKAKNIIAAAKKLRDDFGGKVPRTMKEITTLPGVARKSGNVILGNAYGVVEGIAVDTHVKRFAQVCKLSKHSDPKKIEQDLMKLYPKKNWFSLTYHIIDHGRRSRTKEHKHEPCKLRDLCNDPKF